MILKTLVKRKLKKITYKLFKYFVSKRKKQNLPPSNLKEANLNLVSPARNLQVLTLTEENIKDIEQNLEKDTHLAELNKSKNTFQKAPPTKQEIIEIDLFKISSEFGCGRQQKGFEIVNNYLNGQKKQKKRFINTYFEKKYYFDHNLIELTLKLLRFVKAELQLIYIDHMVNGAILNYSSYQLDLILNQYKNKNFSKPEKTLLICFVAKKFDLLKTLIKHGYFPHSIVCKNVLYIYSNSLVDTGTSFFHSQEFICPAKYKGMLLNKVLKDLGYIRSFH